LDACSRIPSELSVCSFKSGFLLSFYFSQANQ
jgi:hypothetical protein